MGVVGSAFATVFGQFIGALLVILFFIFSKKSTVKLRLETLKPNLYFIKKILVMGLAPFIMSISTIVISIVFN